MNKKLEDSKQQDQIMNLDHRIKQNIDHNQIELKRIDEHNKIIMKEIKSTMESINNNDFFSCLQNDASDTNKILAMKEAGVQESERKIKEIFDKQVTEQQKEKEGIDKVFDSVIQK